MAHSAGPWAVVLKGFNSPPKACRACWVWLLKRRHRQVRRERLRHGGWPRAHCTQAGKEAHMCEKARARACVWVCEHICVCLY